MNIWIMNLKDNREEKPADLLKSKFDFCKENGIVGIGWADYDENSSNSAFSQAENAINAFEIGDLVWVKNPYAETEEERYYICKIKDKAVNTDDEIKNKYDIGKYCVCEFHQIKILPKSLMNERLSALHTIERANDNIAKKTIKAYKGLANTLKRKKSKKIITAIAIILFALICAVIISSCIKAINKKNNPVLPEGLEFGMTYAEISSSTEYLDEAIGGNFSTWIEALERKDMVTLNGKGEKKYKSNLGFADEAIKCVTLFFNEYGELFSVNYVYEQNYFDELYEYYDKSFGGLLLTEYKDGEKDATGYDDSVTCDIGNLSGVALRSIHFEPQKPVISKEMIFNALNQLDYTVGMFSINMAQLINSCVSNPDITYCNLYDALFIYDTTTSDEVEDIMEINSDYASTSFVITVTGDVCQNPELPYLKTQNVEAIKILVILNDNGELQASKVLNECEDLYDYAVLTMCS